MREHCRLQELLEARDLTQAQLARLASVSESLVTLIAQGKRRGRPETRDRISKALGVPEWAIWIKEKARPAGAPSPVTMRELERIAGQIASQFAPERIILFGSYAQGNASPDSDADLLVIMNTDKPPLHVAAEISAAVDHPFPLDIVVLRPADWRQYLEEKANFANQVSQRGVVLYEAVHSRMD